MKQHDARRPASHEVIDDPELVGGVLIGRLKFEHALLSPSDIQDIYSCLGLVKRHTSFFQVSDGVSEFEIYAAVDRSECITLAGDNLGFSGMRSQ